MAVLAVAGVGALAAGGAAWGAGLATSAILTAASIGFSAGAMIGNMLFPAKGPHSEGSRLGDLTVMASSYGVVVPIAAGSVRLSGIVIWGLPLKETAKHEGGGGKGMGPKGGGPTSTTYTYSATFAVSLCEGVASGVRRIWANGALVFDASSGSDTIQKSGFNFRFYPGDEAQLPDSLIVADKGAANTPAYRGTCYVVLDDIPVADYGNRLPNLSFELLFDGVDDLVETALTPGAASLGFSQFSKTAIAINPLTLRGYVGGGAPFSIVEFDIVTMTVTAVKRFGALVSDNSWDSFGLGFQNPLQIGFDQNLYVLMGNYVWVINPRTWTGTYSIWMGNDDNIGAPIIDNIGWMMCPIGLVGLNGIENFTMVTGGNMGRINFYQIDDPAGRNRAGFYPSGANVQLCVGKVGQLHGEAYAVSLDGTTVMIDKLSIGQAIEPGIDGPTAQNTASASLVGTIPMTSIDPDATAITGPSGVIYDATDDGILFETSISRPSGDVIYMCKWANVGGLVWSLAIPNAGGAAPGMGVMFSDVRDGRYAHMWAHHVILLDTLRGRIISDTVWPQINEAQQCWSGTAGAIITGFLSDPDWHKIKVGRLISSPVSLDNIFARILDAIPQIQPGDYSVSALSGITVNGFLVSQRSTAADILAPLAQLYQVDAVEEDDMLVFRPRGGSVVVALTEDDLVRADGAAAKDNPEPYTESRIQEVDLPRRFTISYTDQNADYQVNTQMAARVRFPNPTVFSDQQADLQTAVVMTPDQAAQAAERLLYALWLERHIFKVILPPDYAWLSPGDPVTLQLNDGYLMRGRLGMITLGIDNSVQTTIIGEDDGQYVSVATGAEAAGVIYEPIAVSLPSLAIVLDVPLLRDIDDTGGAQMRAYWTAGPYSDMAWLGASFSVSQDNQAWIGVGVSGGMALYGYLETELIDYVSKFHLDRFQDCTVRMVTGGDTLATVTEEQLWNGYNAAAVIKENGEVEVIQFLEVEDLGSGQYRLSQLQRGVRGTDTMAHSHAAGEMIVMLHTASIEPFTLPLASRNQHGFFRAVTTGLLPSSAIVTRKTMTGRDLMPYAPYNVTAELSGSDIVLTWIRRCRVNGGLLPGTPSVPIGEATEAYEIDILDAPGTTVLRTLTSTSATVTYLAADITTDFGSAPSSLNVRVAQISAIVGRGFSRLDALEIA